MKCFSNTDARYYTSLRKVAGEFNISLLNAPRRLQDDVLQKKVMQERKNPVKF